VTHANYYTTFFFIFLEGVSVNINAIKPKATKPAQGLVALGFTPI